MEKVRHRMQVCLRQQQDPAPATWAMPPSGPLRNGRPHGVNGRMIYKTTHLIDNRDPKGRVAEPGDYVIGEYYEGHLVQGIWYDAYNQVKGSIIIGR